ncbi:MAG TPA: thermonuclease family protein [Xanthobacteraceae bacterium]|jgi:endonuclease YncB( thermonuclease family)
MRRYFFLGSFSGAGNGGALMLAAAIFGLGLATGATLHPHGVAETKAFAAAMPDREPVPELPIARRLDSSIVYPAEVVRVIDGDTFEARVRVWPGLDVDTKIRLRDVDAAELHARCAGELAQAQAARSALETLLAEGGVAISRVGIDKYGGRVDAAVSTRSTADVAAALLNGGYARRYDGGKRGSWCG